MSRRTIAAWAVRLFMTVSSSGGSVVPGSDVLGYDDSTEVLAHGERARLLTAWYEASA